MMKKLFVLFSMFFLFSLFAGGTFSLDINRAGLISCPEGKVAGGEVKAVPLPAGSVLWHIKEKSFAEFDRVEFELSDLKGNFTGRSFSFAFRADNKYHTAVYAKPAVVGNGKARLIFDLSKINRENVIACRLFFNSDKANKKSVSFKIDKATFFNSTDCPVEASADISKASLISCRKDGLEAVTGGVVDTVPKSAGSVFIPLMCDDLSQFDGVKVTLSKLSAGLSSTSFALAVRGTDKKYHYASYLKTPAVTQDKAVLEFNISKIKVKSGDYLRLHINRDNKFTGKSVKLTIDNVEFIRKKAPQPPVSKLPFQKHDRRWDKTYIFPRTQIKYTLFLNYYSADYREVWFDRPLLMDRSMTGNLRHYDKGGNLRNFQKEAETVLSYADGMGILATSRSYLARTLNGMKFADASGVKNFWLLEVSPALADLAKLQGDRDYSFIYELAQKAVDSPSAFRINGKVVISSYCAHALTPEQWKPIIKKLREITNDRIIFVTEIRPPFFQAASEYARNGNKISAETIENLKNFIRSYLDVADGVSFAGCNHVVDGSTDMSNYRFGYDYYKDILLPTMVSVFKEPKYRNKVLGVSAAKGYFYRKNATSGQSEEGTLTLRRSLSAALAVEPDFILMPEWNEANENTHISPTVYDSFASRRVMNHFQNRTLELDKDPVLPNLIASYRREIVPGETLTIELLNVPDPRLNTDKVTVHFALRDINGKMVHDFGKAALSNRELSEKRFQFPVAAWMDNRLLIPDLRWEMNGRSGRVEGMAAILLDTPPTVNKKFVKHPLRDLCVPAKSSLDWKIDDKTVTVTGSIDAGKTISSIELLENAAPVAAVDMHKEFECGENEQILTLVWSSQNPMQARLNIRNLKGSSDTIDNKSIHMSEISRSAFDKKSNILSRNLSFIRNHEQFNFKVTRDAVLEISAGDNKFTVSAADISRLKVYRKIFDDGMCFTLEPAERLFVLPYPVGKNAVDFTMRAAVDTPSAVYSVRMIAADGTIWNSKPFYPQKLSGRKSDIVFWSFKDGKAVAGKIPTEFSRTVDYDFNAGAGDILPAYKYIYSAFPGGSDRFCGNIFAKSTTKSAPKWEEDGGRKVLRFDGKNNYIYIPTLLLSEQSSRVKFSIDPADNSDMMLCNGGYDVTPAFWCNLKDGVLYGSFRNRRGKLFPFKSEKCVVPGRWNDIEMRYDMKQLTLFCNGKVVAQIPCEGLLYKQSLFSFGGMDTPKMPPRFKGRLRQLSLSNVLN